MTKIKKENNLKKFIKIAEIENEHIRELLNKLAKYIDQMRFSTEPDYDYLEDSVIKVQKMVN